MTDDIPFEKMPSIPTFIPNLTGDTLRALADRVDQNKISTIAILYQTSDDGHGIHKIFAKNYYTVIGDCGTFFIGLLIRAIFDIARFMEQWKL